MPARAPLNALLKIVGFVIFLLVASGCAWNQGDRYAGDGTFHIKHPGFFQEGMLVTFNEFDARKPYQNHKKVIRLPRIDQVHYFQLRINNSRFYSRNYHSQGYHWGENDSRFLENSTVKFTLRGENGQIIFRRTSPLSQLPLTSPGEGIVDFLIYSYQPSEDHPQSETISRRHNLQIEFEFLPASQYIHDSPVQSHLILEAGPNTIPY